MSISHSLRILCYRIFQKHHGFATGYDIHYQLTKDPLRMVKSADNCHLEMSPSKNLFNYREHENPSPAVRSIFDKPILKVK